MYMSIQTGDKAPDFTLKDTEKNDVRLSDFKGRNVVLLFFPFAFSSVCTDELCHMRDNLKDYEHLNAAIIGISVDSPHSLSAFREQQGLNFTLLSDFNKEASSAFGALYEDLGGFKGVSKRAAFVIDGDGVIQHTEVLDNPGNQPDYKSIQSCLKEVATG